MTATQEDLDLQAHLRSLARDGGKGTLAVDFDDTLTELGGIEACVELRRRGYGLVIFTANADIEGIVSWIQQRWPADDPAPVVTMTKPQSLAFIDDKAVRFLDWTSILEQFP